MKRLSFLSRNGFTLIEASASALILMIVSLSLYGIYNNSLRILHRSQGHVELKQQAGYALNLMEKEVRSSEGVTVGNSGGRLIVQTKDSEGPVKVEYYCSTTGSKVLYRASTDSLGHVNKVPIADFVAGAGFRLENTLVLITLKMEKGVQHLEQVSAVSLRRGDV